MQDATKDAQNEWFDTQKDVAEGQMDVQGQKDVEEGLKDVKEELIDTRDGQEKQNRISEELVIENDEVNEIGTERKWWQHTK